MFFLTEQDPNFRIKGSRDPLGFQTLWQSLGRTVVRHLSTVSVNLRDFQILSYAWYFYGNRDPKNFLPFFYRFEQAYGFARGAYIPGDAFNGIDFVRKNLGNKSFTFSNKSQHTLLSNQKSYGIYGKYNRPFTEMCIKEQNDFEEVMEISLKEKVNFDELQSKVMVLLSQNETSMSLEDIKIFADSISTIHERERKFYKEHILQTDGTHVQNELFALLEKYDDLSQYNQFNLFAFIQALRNKNISEDLDQKLKEIEQSEQVLAPFVYLFKTLQSEALWDRNKIEEQAIFDSLPKSFEHPFKTEIIADLNKSFASNPYEIALKAVSRNNFISENRGNAAWIKQENNKLITCYADGKRYFNSVHVGQDFEHTYFLPSYVSMYNQIMKR